MLEENWPKVRDGVVVVTVDNLLSSPEIVLVF